MFQAPVLFFVRVLGNTGDTDTASELTRKGTKRLSLKTALG